MGVRLDILNKGVGALRSPWTSSLHALHATSVQALEIRHALNLIYREIKKMLLGNFACRGRVV